MVSTELLWKNGPLSAASTTEGVLNSPLPGVPCPVRGILLTQQVGRLIRKVL